VYPPLRSDVRLSRRITPDGPRIVVKDPVTQRFFQLREAEFAVLERLDGARSLSAIAEEVSVVLGHEVAAADIEPFVLELQRLNLLAGGVPERPRRRPFEGTLLYLRLKAFDPDRLLDRLIGPLGFLFTRRAVLAMAAAIGSALILTFLHRDAILRDIAGQWRLGNLAFAWVTILIVTAGHEFAHGLTCKKFGGEVHEMGFLLIYLQPAFYCNISDAWLFPERSRRLWVTFAGAWFELTVWALATIAWRVVEPGTWIARAALVVLATSGIKLFFNLNPLIKLDGYYLLSDLLEMPNLRQRAVAAVSRALRRLGGFPVAASQTSGHEARVLLTYGVLALTFTWWLLGSIAFHLTGFLTERYQATGALLSAGLVAGIFWPSLRGLLPRRAPSPPAPLASASATAVAPVAAPVAAPAAPAASVALVATTPSPTSLTPTASVTPPALTPPTPAPPAPAGPPPPRARPFSPRAKLLVLAVLTVVALTIARVDLKVAGEVELRPLHNADIRAEVEGIVERIYVEEGTRVRAGDTLVRLADREYRTRLAVVEARIAEQGARLRLMRAGPRPEELDLARVAVVRTEEQLQFALAERNRIRTLRARDAASESELDAAEERASLRARELDEARAQLDLLRAGARPEELAALEEERRGLESERDRLRSQLGSVVLVAPHDGVITTPKLHERLGAFVAPGELIAEVHALAEMRAEIEIPERDIGIVRPAQRAQLRFRALPERTFDGRVTAIAPAVTADSGIFRASADRTVRVQIAVDDTSGILAPGLTGYARISTGERRAIDVVTRRLRRFVRVEFWSWW
jgi:multidrug resistance efflux pump